MKRKIGTKILRFQNQKISLKNKWNLLPLFEIVRGRSINVGRRRCQRLTENKNKKIGSHGLCMTLNERGINILFYIFQNNFLDLAHLCFGSCFEDSCSYSHLRITSSVINVFEFWSKLMGTNFDFSYLVNFP